MKKIFFIGLFLLMFGWFSASASQAGYLLQLHEGEILSPLPEGIEAVDIERGLYFTMDKAFTEMLRDKISEISLEYEVKLIEGAEPVRTFSLPTDELYTEHWQLQMIHADAAWRLETYGNEIKIGVIDSGCYPHEDLKDNLLPGKNYLDGSTDTTDTIGHGTHVSGIIASEMNGSGMVGVAPKAKIVPLKCFDLYQSTYTWHLIPAVRDAVDVFGCQIIHMSLGVPGDSIKFHEIIQYALDKGVIVVASVGNDGKQTFYYPAAYEGVIGVGSVGISKTKSRFSQYNSSVFLVAPGESVKSTGYHGGYQLMSGTSQAAPMVTGAIAAALSAKETLSQSDIETLLAETAEDLGQEGYDTSYGYGLLNTKAFFDKLLERSEYYVSPINQTEQGAYVLIQNRTEEILKANSIFSLYDSGKLTSCIAKPITVLPGKEVLVTTLDNADSITHFLWNDFSSLKPVAVKRTTNE